MNYRQRMNQALMKVDQRLLALDARDSVKMIEAEFISHHIPQRDYRQQTQWTEYKRYFKPADFELAKIYNSLPPTVRRN